MLLFLFLKLARFYVLAIITIIIIMSCFFSVSLCKKREKREMAGQNVHAIRSSSFPSPQLPITCIVFLSFPFINRWKVGERRAGRQVDCAFKDLYRRIEVVGFFIKGLR
ncbi:hypothetical protein OIU77_026601 [Salix suchowensis]|uniref:Uncharacterized protein n=1 Tax=Salix suchowensis TaxID=1278906 RepID=A0ABQ9BPG0_9ROSI|nr:hypothetical protein OIU77_026601 [Salix suchowensis]